MQEGVLDLKSIVVQDDEPVATEVAGEVVMLSARAQAYFGLGEVGSEVWKLLERPCTIQRICERIRQEFDVDARTCEDDVLRFVGELLRLRLVRQVREEEAA